MRHTTAMIHHSGRLAHFREMGKSELETHQIQVILKLEGAIRYKVHPNLKEGRKAALCIPVSKISENERFAQMITNHKGFLKKEMTRNRG